MEVKLLYPTNELAKVNAIAPTGAMIKIFGTIKYYQDGTMGGRILSNLCGADHKTEHDKYGKISVLDAVRIARASKRVRLNNNTYIPKGVKDKEGNPALPKFNLAKDVTASDIFSKEHECCGLKVQLKPPSTKEQSEQIALMMNAGIDESEAQKLIDMSVTQNIKSINGKAPQSDDVPLDLFDWLGEILKEETDKFNLLSSATDPDNGAEYTIGIWNQNFIIKR